MPGREAGLFCRGGGRTRTGVAAFRPVGQGTVQTLLTHVRAGLVCGGGIREVGVNPDLRKVGAG